MRNEYDFSGARPNTHSRRLKKQITRRFDKDAMDRRSGQPDRITVTHMTDTLAGEARNKKSQPNRTRVKESLVRVKMPYRKKKVDLCLGCLRSEGRLQQRVAVVFVCSIMAIPLGAVAGVVLNSMLGSPFDLGGLLLHGKDEFLIVGVLATLSIASAVTCGLVIDRQNKQRRGLRRAVVMWRSWMDANWLRAVGVMNLVVLGLIWIVAAFRVFSLLTNYSRLDLVQWLAVAIYTILLLMAAVDFARLFMARKSVELDHRIREARMAVRWEQVVDLAKGRTGYTSVQPWILFLIMSALGGVIASIAYYKASQGDINSLSLIVVTSVLLSAFIFGLQKYAFSLGLGTLSEPSQASRLWRVIGDGILLSLQWGIVMVVLRVVSVFMLGIMDRLLRWSLVAAAFWGELALPVMWLFVIALGGSGRGPLKGFAVRLANAAVRVEQNGGYAPEAMSRSLGKQAEELHRELHAKGPSPSRKCSTVGCFNYSGPQQGGRKKEKKERSRAPRLRSRREKPLLWDWVCNGFGLVSGVLVSVVLAVAMWCSR